MKIINKYLVGLFNNIRTAEFRKRIAVAAQVSKVGVFEIVILYGTGMF